MFEVSASVYDLSEYNSLAESIGSGIYHVGIQVAGLEWSFGACDDGTGIFFVEPRTCSIGTFKESVLLGETHMEAEDILVILYEMAPKWLGPDYHVLEKNCLKFSQSFLDQIVAGAKIPAYATATADSLKYFKKAVKKASRGVIQTTIALQDSSKMWRDASIKMREYSRLHRKIERGRSIQIMIPLIIHAGDLQESDHELPDTELYCNYVKSVVNRNRDNYSAFSRSMLR